MRLGCAPGAVHRDVSPFITALDQAAFHQELERLCISEWQCGAPEDVRVEPLRARDHPDDRERRGAADRQGLRGRPL